MYDVDVNQRSIAEIVETFRQPGNDAIRPPLRFPAKDCCARSCAKTTGDVQRVHTPKKKPWFKQAITWIIMDLYTWICM